MIDIMLDATLLGEAREWTSWFMGANIPGKPMKPLFYFGGANAYFRELTQSAENDFPGYRMK
jgi:cyclohexanone monooxygenase